ncbi:MAG: hypothetical protein PHE54_02735 [Bacilli bacterium]|nr:hypothetical protein [Bacilli bacterium]
MLEMDSSEITCLLNSSEDRIIKKWLVSLGIYLTVLLFVMSIFKYHNYDIYYGTVALENNNYILKLFINEDDMSDFNTSILLYNNEKINYELSYISDKLYITDNFEMGYEVHMIIDLNEEDKILNNIIEIKKRLEDTTMMQTIINFIKKGMI